MITNHGTLPTEMTAPPDRLQRWMSLLRTPHNATDELYDADEGIKQDILRAFGFHDEYLSYSSSNKTSKLSCLKAHGHNWASVSRVARALRGKDSVRLLHWNYTTFVNQVRVIAANTPAAAAPHQVSVGDARSEDDEVTNPAIEVNPFETHARGVFIHKARNLFVIYEPQKYRNQVSSWFGSSLNDFARCYQGMTHLIIYGNQRGTSDCERRAMHFGVCCWQTFFRN